MKIVQTISHRYAIAPMMNWTDRHFRYFVRCLAQNALLYTEMIHANAIVHGKKRHLLAFDPFELPLVLQLGGSEPALLAQAAKIGEDFGYNEINLKVGCPSPRVSSGRFGACLWKEPQQVADCVAAMRDAINIPVTLKIRIGVDDHDSEEYLHQFIKKMISAGCATFIVHARKAWLHGLNPKENREIPPLRYEIVHQLKKSFPDQSIIINGGLNNLTMINEQLKIVDGVMLGRAAYYFPYWLTEVENQLFPSNKPLLTRQQIIEQYIPYVANQLQQGVRLSQITRHILGLFHNVPGARSWRRYLTEESQRPDAGVDVLLKSLELI